MTSCVSYGARYSRFAQRHLRVHVSVGSVAVRFRYRRRADHRRDAAAALIVRLDDEYFFL